MNQQFLFGEPSPSPTITEARALGEAGMKTVAENAGEEFRDNAKNFVIDYLSKYGPASGETITDACKEAGIVPHSDRAFGPVIMSLQRKGLIEKCGTVARRKGHGAPGGCVWRITGTE